MKNLSWYDKLHLFALILLAGAISVGIHCGLLAGAFLGAASIVKMVAQRRVGNSALSKPSMVAFLALVLYVLLHIMSLLHGCDIHEGLGVIIRKAVLLIFAACFLLSDTSYLQERHIRWIVSAFWCSLCGVILYYAGVGVGKCISGCTLKEVVGAFDPRHHAYTALYADSVLAFVYVILQSRWGTLKRWLRTALIASVPLLVLYMLMENSRAGILVMWMVAAMCILHLSLHKHCWKQGILIALLFTGYTLGVSHVLPGHTDRIAETVEKVAESTKDEKKSPDARIGINKSALTLAMERPWFGYGVGNYKTVLVGQFEEINYKTGVKERQNAHNQYTETILAVGIIGLIPMLVFLLFPLYQAWKKRKYLLPVLLFTSIVCLNLLFESMLERQMGLQFIGYFMSVMVLLENLEGSSANVSLR